MTAVDGGEPETNGTNGTSVLRPAATSKVAIRMIRNDPLAYLWSWLQWVLFHMAPLPVGWVVKLVLDRFTDGVASTPWVLLATILGLEVSRWVLLVSAAVQWHGAWVGWMTVPRVNALSSLATGSGPVAGRLPG